MKQLILGGARSGKSNYAQQLAANSKKQVIYIATAFAGDPEMLRRIQRHQQMRPEAWELIEEQIALADTLSKLANNNTCILVDCLTLWLSNLLCSQDPQLFQSQRDALLDIFPQLPGDIILVSNEVGQGIIPTGALSRRFVDEAGWLHQSLTPHCDRVFFVTAGLPLSLK